MKHLNIYLDLNNFKCQYDLNDITKPHEYGVWELYVYYMLCFYASIYIIQTSPLILYGL